MPIFIIEGNIGSGKSTLINELGQTKFKGFEHVVVQEPVNEFSELLEKYYSDPKKYGFVFQVKVLTAQITALNKVIQSVNPKTVIFCERSVFTAREVFVKMMDLDPVERKVIDDLYTLMISMSKFKVDGCIYLKTPVAVCAQRIVSRGRPGEENITDEYLQRVHDHHEMWLKGKEALLTLEEISIELIFEFVKAHIPGPWCAIATIVFDLLAPTLKKVIGPK